MPLEKVKKAKLEWTIYKVTNSVNDKVYYAITKNKSVKSAWERSSFRSSSTVKEIGAEKFTPSFVETTIFADGKAFTQRMYDLQNENGKEKCYNNPNFGESQCGKNKRVVQYERIIEWIKCPMCSIDYVRSELSDHINTKKHLAALKALPKSSASKKVIAEILAEPSDEDITDLLDDSEPDEPEESEEESEDDNFSISSRFGRKSNNFALSSRYPIMVKTV